MRLSAIFTSGLLVFAAACAHAQQMADGPDKDLFVKTCSNCHEIERVLSQRQDQAGWEATVAKMKGYGLQADDSDLRRIIAYLAANLPAEPVNKLNINTAARIDFEAILGVKRSVAAAIIDYRDKNGPFKSIDELKKVPGVDAAKVDEKKDSLTF
jgi:competence protein ComEA